MNISVRYAIFRTEDRYWIRLDGPYGFINSRDMTLDELRDRVRILREQGHTRDRYVKH